MPAASEPPGVTGVLSLWTHFSLGQIEGIGVIHPTYPTKGRESFPIEEIILMMNLDCLVG